MRAFYSFLGLSSILFLSACVTTQSLEQRSQITRHIANFSKCTTGEHVLAHINESPDGGWKAQKEYACTEHCGLSQRDKSIDGKVYTSAALETLGANSEFDTLLKWAYVKGCK